MNDSYTFVSILVVKFMWFYHICVDVYVAFWLLQWTAFEVRPFSWQVAYYGEPAVAPKTFLNAYFSGTSESFRQSDEAPKIDAQNPAGKLEYGDWFDIKSFFITRLQRDWTSVEETENLSI